MINAITFMDSFMEKLKANDFNKDNQPSESPEITRSSVAEQVESYTVILKSEIIDVVTKQSNLK